MEAIKARLASFSTDDFTQKPEGEKASLRQEMFRDIVEYYRGDPDIRPHLQAMKLMRAHDGAAAITTHGHMPWAVGMEFKYRAELLVLGLHNQVQAGICGVQLNGKYTAAAIVSSGGYEDDQDGNTTLTYTGHGGQWKYRSYEPKVQVEDQEAETFGHKAMMNAYEDKEPIRVIKGTDAEGQYKCYTYDGMYEFQSAPTTKTGISGKLVNVYHLVKQQ